MELKNVEIIKLGELKTFDSGFSLVEFVVKTEDADYPQFISFQATKEKAENLLKYNKVGQRVDVSFNVRGRKWESPSGEVKYFNTLEAWKIFKSEDSFKPEAQAEVEETEDALPF
jgi:single-stranded DNA-binding protein